VVRRVVPGGPLWDTTIARAFLILVTFVLVCFAWVFFRATSFDQAFRIVRAMVGDGAGVTHGVYGWFLLPVLALVGAHAAMRSTTLEAVVERTPWPVRTAALAGMIFSLFLCSGVDRAFIYFQF
jgi:hypothetical protein